MIRGLKGLYHWLEALIASIWFGFPSRKLTVIGVTGTDGKTTTTTLIYEILASAGYKVSMITSVHAVVAGKTYDTGFHVTNPRGWHVQRFLRQAVDHGDTHFVLEVTSHGLSQHRVDFVRFAVGVLTNVTHEHLDWHKTFDAYLRTKISLLRRARVAVINRDEAEVYNKASELLRRKRVVTYGIRRDSLISPKTHPFTTKLIGTFNRYNCLAAIAATDALGVPLKSVRAAVGAFGGVKGRMEEIVHKPFRVIVDFAHTPNAIEQALKTIRKSTKRRIIHVFGSAALRDRTKRPLMGKASGRYADVIVLTEEDYRTEDVNRIIDEIASGIPAGKVVMRLPDRDEAIGYAIAEAKPGDTVIITGKGHEKSIARGKIEYPWSDQEAVKKHLRYAAKN
ncbi:UDP-N-acetylmuramoyl-L-alanyl-D-glutamate--2,6-diaminopimelate ligase [Candidatus Gottesmanbacteria bacterium]|nr:UDP-N-acetylmuramoyl-L-alanyl-D-glutamate--2,6-diaminopimelate ligase [Candidatus Gottesmanbacteria bacterium]